MPSRTAAAAVATLRTALSASASYDRHVLSAMSQPSRRLVTHATCPTVALPGQHSSRMSTAATAASSSSSLSSSPTYDWCVVGAGPAGIAAVGVLLDSGVAASSLLWVDPQFAVGDFGTAWRRVSSNTTVGLFRRFYSQCKAFDHDETTVGRYAIAALKDKQTCLLDDAAAPLRDITLRLRKKVPSAQAEVRQVRQRRGRWECLLSSHTPAQPAAVVASNLVLATGAEPRDLSMHAAHPHLKVIPVKVALNPELLASALDDSSTVCVVGSSHTAVIVIRTLLERTRCRQVVNLYREPLRYALYMDDWILFDDTGLKGDTARWAREHLHDTLPDRLSRSFSDDAAVSRLLPGCSHVIYATGFSSRRIQAGIDGLPPSLPYNAHCGIIAPGLFGCGIGFPEERTDRYGNVEFRVGLWKFMQYLETAVPLWKKYSLQEGIGQPKGAPGTEKQSEQQQQQQHDSGSRQQQAMTASAGGAGAGAARARL